MRRTDWRNGRAQSLRERLFYHMQDCLDEDLYRSSFEKTIGAGLFIDLIDADALDLPPREDCLRWLQRLEHDFAAKKAQILNPPKGHKLPRELLESLDNEVWPATRRALDGLTESTNRLLERKAMREPPAAT